MDNEREDTGSVAASNAGDGSEAPVAAESALAAPERSKNGGSSPESGVDVDRNSAGHGSTGSEEGKEIAPIDMVRQEYKFRRAFCVCNLTLAN